MDSEVGIHGTELKWKLEIKVDHLLNVIIVTKCLQFSPGIYRQEGYY